MANTLRYNIYNRQANGRLRSLGGSAQSYHYLCWQLGSGRFEICFGSYRYVQVREVTRCMS